jgi:hypothetical protein
MLSVIMLSVIMLSVVMLSVSMLSVFLINHLFYLIPNATSQFKTNFIMIAMTELLINLQWENILWSDKKRLFKTIGESISAVTKFWFSKTRVI